MRNDLRWQVEDLNWGATDRNDLRKHVLGIIDVAIADIETKREGVIIQMRSDCQHRLDAFCEDCHAAKRQIAGLDFALEKLRGCKK